MDLSNQYAFDGARVFNVREDSWDKGKIQVQTQTGLDEKWEQFDERFKLITRDEWKKMIEKEREGYQEFDDYAFFLQRSELLSEEDAQRLEWDDGWLMPTIKVDGETVEEVWYSEDDFRMYPTYPVKLGDYKSIPRKKA
jgi:intergrase/recombinase